ncbi:hypothetical protein PG984_016372 [Apiospora sp. TS-2023a]
MAMYGTFDRRQTIYHSSLSSKELRLLKPVRSSHDSLHFEIATFPRDAAPLYTAVSYTWGDGDASEVIHINGFKFPVRLNLWSCLYYLSQAKVGSEWEYMWVDAICINQSDDREKSAQVRCMDQTYRLASCVSVWLGLPAVPEHLKTRINPGTPIRTFEPDPYDWWDSISYLTNRPYWSRFWVIQEFLLGRSVRVHCGNTSMDWFDFRDLVYREDLGHDTLLPDGNPRAIPPNASAAVPLLMGRSINRLPEYPQALHILLVQHRHSMCKDPRDRVFALLGLVSEDERLFLGRIFPDYTLSERHVLIITLAHLTQYMPLAADLGKVTPDSEELFRGLGVPSKSQRRQLLRRAADFDYIGCESSDDFVRVLAFHDELEEYRPSERDVEPEDAVLSSHETTRYSKRRWLLGLSVFGVGAGLAAYFSYRHGGIRLWGLGVRLYCRICRASS